MYTLYTFLQKIQFRVAYIKPRDYYYPGGGTSLKEANGDVQPDGITFSQLVDYNGAAF